MLTTIDLDNQSMFNAAEVRYVRSDWMLAAKFNTADLSCAQSPPQFGFCVSLFIAELPRPISQFLSCQFYFNWTLTLTLSRKRARESESEDFS
jgi:hypothetical protein